MALTINAVVLAKIKYKDNDLIVKCYSQEKGVLSIILRGVLNSKKNNSKAAYFQLLSQLQLVIDYKTNRTLHTVKETKLNYFYTSLHSNVAKGSIVMFLSEVLSIVLKEEEANETLYSYVITMLQWLDTKEEFANFHLFFLLNLTKYLGFYPQDSNITGEFFNLMDGKFEDQKNNQHSVSGDGLMILKQLLVTNLEDLSQIKMNATQRQSFLKMMLHYYELHLGNFKAPKSLQILNQVFS